MKLEDVMPYLRKGAEVRLKGVALGGNAVLCRDDLLSEEFEASLTDEQIIAVWEADLKLRQNTGQSAQAALLSSCIKMLRTRKL